MSDQEKPKPTTRYEIPAWISGDKTPKIFPAMIAANRLIEAVAKTSRNQQQGYSFRGIDAVYDMVHGVLAEAGIITIPRVLERRTSERKTKSGGDTSLVELEVEYWCYAEDGSALVIGPIWSEALDNSDKATNKALAFAQKYALLQTFTIPTSDVSEGDRETIERGQRQEPAAKGEETIGEPTAAKVYAAFAELGITQEQLHEKLGRPVAVVPAAALEQLKEWRTEISNDKRRAVAIFGAPKSRVVDINNRIANKAPHPQEGPPQ